MTQTKRINDIRTHDGVAVGFSLICDITKHGKSNRLKYCSTFTEYDIEPTVERQMDGVERAGQKINRIKKSEDFDKFTELVSEFEFYHQEKLKYKVLHTNIKALSDAYQKYAPDPDVDCSANLFGFVGADEQLWIANQSTAIQFFSEVHRERMEALAYILEALFLHFETNDLESHGVWLHQSRAEIQGTSVWKLLTSGKMSDLFLAANFVNRVLG